jgi:acetyl esterase/lipase
MSPVGPVVYPPRPTGAVVLYVHGEPGLSSAPPPGHPTAARLALDAGATVVCCGYRAWYPAAVDDVHAAYEYCRSLGRVALVGERLGGGLVAALLLRLRDLDAAQPECAVLVGALLDLTLEAPSVSLNAAAHPGFDAAEMRRRTARYSAGAALTDPLLSPVYGNLHGLPPIQLLAVGNDPLVDDSLAFAARAARSGVAVDLRVAPVEEGRGAEAGAMADFIGNLGRKPCS